jgi:NTP pyrophosphatase (non-canonical NTP hydrolase)
MGSCRLSAAEVYLPVMDLNELSRQCHQANKQWWHDLQTGERLNRNKGELLMLIVSEIAEAMEGERKGLQSEKLNKHYSLAEEELADALIRIFDYAGGFNLNLNGAFWDKMNYNASRADHKPEARLDEGGKKW